MRSLSPVAKALSREVRWTLAVFVVALACSASSLPAKGSGAVASALDGRPSGSAPPTGGSGAASEPLCQGTGVPAGGDLRAAVEVAPEGATLCLAAGTHRLEAAAEPKARQQLIGEAGAIINGAKVVEGFARAESDFVASGFLPSTPSDAGQCVVAGCSYAQDVFIDGAPLIRVTDRAQLGPGHFYEDFAANKIYLRDDPSGHLVEQALAPALVSSSNPEVVVRNLVLEKAANVAQTAAVFGGGDGWVVEHNEIRFNHASGVECGSCTVRANAVHHNGQLGMGGFQGSGQVVEGNEVAFNNTAGYESVWEAGGSKWVGTKNLLVRGNYFHHNQGSGLWTDANNTGTRFEDNYVSDNADFGILHEISYDAVIRNNIVVRNGSNPRYDEDGLNGGIRVAQSPNVEVVGNTLIDNRNGFHGFQLASEAEAPNGPHELVNLHVHDNDISMTRGISGLEQLDNDPTYYSAARNNRFRNNHYHLDDLAAVRFVWQGGKITAKQWQAEGQDVGGTFDTRIRAVPPPPELSVGPRAR